PGAPGGPPGRPDETRAQSTIGDGIVLQAHLLFERSVRDPVLIVLITGRSGLHIRNPRNLILGLFLSIANDRVGGDAVLHRAQPNLFTTGPHVGDLGGHPFRRIAVHHVRIARPRYQLLGGRTLTAGVNRWPRPTKRLWLEDRLFDLVVAAGVAEALFGPRPVHDAEPFVGPGVAVVMLLE